MKLKLFSKVLPPAFSAFAVVVGGLDTDTAKMVFVVKSDDDTSGTLTMDPSEARRLAELIQATVPAVTKVENGQ
jgi:hypothetical protein